MRQIPAVYKLVSQIDASSAAAAANRLLTLGRIRDIEAALAAAKADA